MKLNNHSQPTGLRRRAEKFIREIIPSVKPPKGNGLLGQSLICLIILCLVYIILDSLFVSRKEFIQLQMELKSLKKKSLSEKELMPIWAAINILEHGVQKINNDFTPNWPMPPEECSHFPRQLEIKPFSYHVRQQMYYGPMKKMALVADKVRVKDLVRSFGCPNLHIIPNLGVWDVKNISSLDFTKLPSSYALKANFAAGFVVIVKNNIVQMVTTNPEMQHPDSDRMKELVNKPVQPETVITYFKWALGTLYRGCTEPHYAFIDKLILAEPLVTSRSGSFPLDYKLFATKGKFLIGKVFLDRNADARIGFVDRHFNVLNDYGVAEGKKLASQADMVAIKPEQWDQMVQVAECLSLNIYRWGGLRLARVDLYDWDGKVTFGELTLTPVGGAPSFQEEEHEMEIGAQFM